MKDNSFNIGVCRLWPGEKLASGDQRWGRHAHSFSREHHTIETLCEAVAGAGAAISAVMKDGHRITTNFVEASHLGLDFDAGDTTSSVATISANPFISEHGAFTYATPSSTPEHPKARAVFVLDHPITDPAEYRTAALALISKFGATADPACHDPARFFYGSPETDHELLGNILYADVLQEQVIEPYLESRPAEGSARSVASPVTDFIPEGNRNGMLMSLAGSMRRRNLSQAAITAAMIQENLERCNPPLPEAEVLQIVDSVMRYNPSAMSMPAVRPPPDLPVEDESTSDFQTWVSGMGSNGNTPTNPHTTVGFAFLHELPLTDLGNAERMILLHGKSLRYSYQLKKWFVWDGKRWNANMNGEVYRRASHTVRQMYAEASQLESHASNLTDDDERAKVAKNAELLSAFARKSESVSRLEAMVRLAESREGVSVMLSSMDSDPWLMNVNNGTLNLRDCTLKPHDSADLMTKLAPVNYTPGEGYALWDEFLDYILPDLELRSFVQRAAGYTLTGLNSEEKLFFAYGPTATGKSTFFRAMRCAMGDYSAVADFATFLEKTKGGNGATNDIARLAGMRFVVSIEVEQGQKLAESLIQTITGGDPIAARFLYSESFEFIPTFTLWMAANNRPRVRDDNDANWRRIVQIPFASQIPVEKRDDNVKHDLSDPEIAGPAVLAWLVEGCRQWQNEGLSIPDIVKQTTEEYREEMNPLTDFFEQKCVFVQEGRVSNQEIWDAYLIFVRENSIRYPLGRKAFTQRLSGMAGIEQHNSGGRFWKGLGLLGPELDDY